eukprot:FR734780.1.p1 GENE.FR734780.1~~FR734780.1.p1  ORF type:complete len:108 (+),score=7.58 FR734780.1:299-622(+)
MLRRQQRYSVNAPMSHTHSQANQADWDQMSQAGLQFIKQYHSSEGMSTRACELMSVAYQRVEEHEIQAAKSGHLQGKHAKEKWRSKKDQPSNQSQRRGKIPGAINGV